jgi:hypothetical protein
VVAALDFLGQQPVGHALEHAQLLRLRRLEHQPARREPGAGSARRPSRRQCAGDGASVPIGTRALRSSVPHCAGRSAAARRPTRTS